MKQLPILVATLLTFSLLITPVMATTDTSVSDVVGNNNTVTTNTTAQTSTSDTDNEIQLDMPIQTDNPSTIITFVNPAKDESTIQLEIDSKGFSNITSPYTFSALSIGKHTLEFKYKDENDTTQIYDTSLIIIPRAPILGTPVIGTEDVTIAGTGLANSEVIIILSSGSSVFTEIATIDGDGKWSISFKKDDLTKDVYSLNAYTRRYGYASNLSETIKFTLDKNSSSFNSDLSTFSFSNITLESLTNWVISNQTYLITGGSCLLIGVMLGILFVSTRKKKIIQKVEKKVAEEFVKIDPKEKDVTLREKLMGITKPTTPSSDKKTDVKEGEKDKAEEKKEETVINKIDFLKDFKNFDPDNTKGEEKKSTVEVSLTSKK
ncbi:hypothetical protein KKA50_00220 [Patescibacteria group bacterium]|nr:hypothetical protein [Patescibacteria group bacterium]